jgi:predicted nucleic acid-binding protein
VEPAKVGLILDSSIIISAERKGKSVREILEQVRTTYGEVDLGLSVVTVAELMHGAYRAQRRSGKRGDWPLSRNCAAMYRYTL